MANFEGLTRPFQAPIYTPPARVQTSAPTPTENVLLVIGKGRTNNFKVFHGSYDISTTGYMIKVEKENPTP